MTKCVSCDGELSGRQTKFCSNRCKQSNWRKKTQEAMKLVEIVGEQPNEPCLPLSAHQSNRIAESFKNCQFWPDDFPQFEIDEIKSGPKWWLHRWTRSLNAWGLMGQAKGIIYRGSESDFEHRYRTDGKFRSKIKKQARTYQDHRGMARIKVP
jgi:hypothetical protein